MDCVLKNAMLPDGSGFRCADIAVREGRIVSISKDLSSPVSIDLHNAAVFPGFVDVHVHLREPGFSYKETVRTGTLSAARGGYAHICPMPNLNPAPDTLENLEEQEDEPPGTP